MAAKIGQGDRLLELLEEKLKNLSPEASREPLLVSLDKAA